MEQGRVMVPMHCTSTTVLKPNISYSFLVLHLISITDRQTNRKGSNYNYALTLEKHKNWFDNMIKRMYMKIFLDKWRQLKINQFPLKVLGFFWKKLIFLKKTLTTLCKFLANFWVFCKFNIIIGFIFHHNCLQIYVITDLKLRDINICLPCQGLAWIQVTEKLKTSTCTYYILIRSIKNVAMLFRRQWQRVAPTNMAG